MPAVSVVIPAYNRAHLLPRAVNSVLNQTFTDLEVIVADDGSTDNIREVVASFGDPRVRLVRNEQRSGAAVARNTGLQAANGKLIAFLDSDDEWLLDKLALQIDALNRLQTGDRSFAAAGCSRGSTESSTDSIEHTWISSTGEEVRQTLLGIRPTTIRTLWMTLLAPKQALLDAGGFDSNLPASQWWDLVMRLADRCDFLETTRQVIVLYDPGGQRVRNMENMGLAAEMLLQKYDLSALGANASRNNFLTYSGIYRLSRGEYRTAVSRLTSAFIAKPSLRAAARVSGALLGRRLFFGLRNRLGRRSDGGMAKNPLKEGAEAPVGKA